MNTHILSVKGLTKDYGSLRALDNLHLEVSRGQVFGILGPNGSGKTTTLGIILDVLKAKSGTFEWFGEKGTPDHRKRIGAILEEPIFYPYMSAVDNLKVTAKIKKASYDRIDEVLQTVDLLDRKHDKFKTYSYGMRQRLAIAGALVANPEVLILDEPTNGLDPKGIAEIRELILRIADMGITIIMASHMLDEVQKVCSHVAILQKGKLRATGSVEEVLQDNKTLEVASDNSVLLKEKLATMDAVKSVKEENHLLIITVTEETTTAAFNQALFEEGVVLSHLALRKKSLEKFFLDVIDNES